MPPSADQIIAGLLDSAASAVRTLDLTAIGEDGRDVASKLWRIASHLRNRSAATPFFRCPCCDAVTHNPNDIEEHYCGLCHWWTGDPVHAPYHFASPCPNRVQRDT